METNILTKRANLDTSTKHESKCPECGSIDIITDDDSGELICGACGLVVNDTMIDESPEWRSYTPEDREAKIRVGAPTNLQKFDKGLSTTFQTYTDVHGKSLAIQDRYKMMRLKKWQNRVNTNTNNLRNLAQAMTNLTMLSDNLSIPPLYRRTQHRFTVKLSPKA